MNEQSSLPKLIPLGEKASYCDPITGECDFLDPEEQTMTIAIDPVCKMEVEIETAQFKSEYEGETYYFCAPGCQRAFEKEPQKYLTEHSHAHNENP